MSVLHRVPLALLAALSCLCVLLVPATALAATRARPFIWPTTGRITQPFGCTGFRMEPRYGSCAHFHYGVDIANRLGTPVYAAASGVVTIAGWDPWLRHDPDWMVMIGNGDGFQTMYAHLKVRLARGIRRGARVRQGQLIGWIGLTGRTTGPHLEFGVFLRHRPVNPVRYVRGSLRR